MKQKDPVPVQPEMCGSCPFRTDGQQVYLRPGRLEEIKRSLIVGKTHICHHAALHKTGGPTRACRGGRDYQLEIWCMIGRIAEPTDEALNATMDEKGLEPIPCSPRRRTRKEPAEL